MIYKIKKIIRAIMPQFVISGYHLGLVWLSAFLYHFPSRHMVVIGVTGTKGKTTVTELANAFLEKMGRRTALINSLRFKIGEKTWPNKLKMTMPGRFFIQKFLYNAWRKKCNYVIVEVTSEGIKQFRHKFINFDVVAFNNLQPEHLEAHGGSMEKYREAKEKLFAALDGGKKRIPICERIGQFEVFCKNASVVNMDDLAAPNFLKYPASEKIGFSLKNKDGGVKELIQPQKYSVGSEGIKFELDGLEFYSSLKGEFNLYNILSAIAICRALDVPLTNIKDALQDFDGIPGRMEEIKQGQDFRIFVDFAHTPDSLLAVYQTLRQEVPKGSTKLIAVFGSTGGGRDKWKRPAMGKVAADYCDEIIITNDDPYDENPQKILEEIAIGVKVENHSYKMIEDRREAIREAFRLAKKGDCVIITGKGSEQAMVMAGGKKIPWDDRKVVKEELENLKTK